MTCLILHLASSKVNYSINIFVPVPTLTSIPSSPDSPKKSIVEIKFGKRYRLSGMGCTRVSIGTRVSRGVISGNRLY